MSWLSDLSCYDKIKPRNRPMLKPHMAFAAYQTRKIVSQDASSGSKYMITNKCM